MDSPIRVSDDLRSQGLMNLIQVKQEADEGPHIVYDEKEQWAFLFSGISEEVGECELKEIKSEPESGLSCCHWCPFTTSEPLDLIDHDYESHSRFIEGRRIHKSYKCPVCEFTSVDPVLIRDHYTRIHSISPVDATEDITPLTTPKKNKKKKSWSPLKIKRESYDEDYQDDEAVEEEEEESSSAEEERRLKSLLQKRKYRASLSPEALAKRRLNDAARMRLSRALESEEKKAERRRKQALRARTRRANETPEQVELRRTKQRFRARVRRSQESEEQREIRKERERLRARERRASLSTDKKERLKEIERNRKRFVRSRAKLMHGAQSHYIDAMEFLTTSLSNSENSYLLGQHAYELSDPHLEAVVNGSAEHFIDIPSLSKSKRTTNKGKRNRSRNKSKQNNRTNSQNDNDNFASFTSPAHLLKLASTDATYSYNQVVGEQFNERIACNANTPKDISGTNLQVTLAPPKETSVEDELDHNLTSNYDHENNKIDSSCEESELFNNLKQNQDSKNDKINKLLHRMCGKDPK